MSICVYQIFLQIDDIYELLVKQHLSQAASCYYDQNN